jgi:hypothetical protein
MNPEQIVQTALRAMAVFFERERGLLEANANERSITHKIAEHLQRAFPDWHVDCEYNRLGYKVKRLPPVEDTTTGDTEGRTIFPDIIVHRRGQKDNLLVIEVKKTTNTQPGDEVKLSGLTDAEGEYSYSLGLHFVIDCHRCMIAEAVAFTRGSVDEEITSFARRVLAEGPRETANVSG